MFFISQEDIDSLPEDYLQGIFNAVKEGVKTSASSLGLEDTDLLHIEDIALTYYRNKDYQKAILIYGLLIRIKEDHLSAWRGLGACVQALRLYDIAAGVYGQALLFDDTDIITRVLLGESLCFLGFKEDALKHLNIAIKQETDNVTEKMYLTRAHAIIYAQGRIPPPLTLRNNGEYLNSLIKKEDKIEYDPKKPLQWEDIQKNKPLLYVIKDLNDALKQGQISLKDIGGFTGNELEGAYACACQYIHNNQLLETIKIVGYLIILSPQDARYHQLMAIALHRLEQYESAEYYYKIAFMLDPNNLMTLIYHAECKLLLGEIEAGKEMLHQGLTFIQEDLDEQKELFARARALLEQFANKKN